MSDKGLVSSTYKELLQINKKKITFLVGKDMKRQFTKGNIKMTDMHKKILYISSYQRYMQKETTVNCHSHPKEWPKCKRLIVSSIAQKDEDQLSHTANGTVSGSPCLNSNFSQGYTHSAVPFQGIYPREVKAHVRTET